MLGRKMKDFDAKFQIEINPFSEFLVNSIFKYQHGANLRLLYYEYRKVSNETLSDEKLYKLAQAFYASIKDTELVRLIDESVLTFPKSHTATLHMVY